MRIWKYTGIDASGREITAASREGLHIISVRLDIAGMIRQLMPRQGLPAGVMAQLFDDMQGMYAGGMGLAPILAAMKETTADPVVLDALSAIEQDMRQGRTLADAVEKTKAFPWVVSATLHAGEKSGKWQEVLAVLGKYFRQRQAMQGRLIEALMYPAIVFICLAAAMVFVSLHLMPRLKDLLPAQAEGGPMSWALAASAFLCQQWMWVAAGLMVLAGGFVLWAQRNPHDFQAFAYRWPVLGKLVKESDMGHYFLNLSVLLKSGVPLLRAVHDLHALYPTYLSGRFVKARAYMFSGLPFWESLRTDDFFPMPVVFMVRRGEEMAKLDEYCSHLSDYFDQRVTRGTNTLVQVIQPLLLALAGTFLAALAFTFLVPIYGNLTKIAGG